MFAAGGVEKRVDRVRNTGGNGRADDRLERPPLVAGRRFLACQCRTDKSGQHDGREKGDQEMASESHSAVGPGGGKAGSGQFYLSGGRPAKGKPEAAASSDKSESRDVEFVFRFGVVGWGVW